MAVTMKERYYIAGFVSNIFTVIGICFLLAGPIVIVFNPGWMPYGALNFTGIVFTVMGFLILMPYFYYRLKGGMKKGFSKGAMAFFQAVIILFLTLSLLGEYGLYNDYILYDSILHTAMPFALYFLLYILLYTNARIKKLSTNFLLVRVFVYCALASLLWEVFEMSVDGHAPFPQFVTAGDSYDLIKDLVSDFIGITLGFTLAYKYGHRFACWLGVHSDMKTLEERE